MPRFSCNCPEEGLERNHSRHLPANTTATMRKYKVGDHLLVKLTAARIVEATVKAVLETTNGVRLQV